MAQNSSALGHAILRHVLTYEYRDSSMNARRYLQMDAVGASRWKNPHHPHHSAQAQCSTTAMAAGLCVCACTRTHHTSCEQWRCMAARLVPSAQLATTQCCGAPLARPRPPVLAHALLASATDSWASRKPRYLRKSPVVSCVHHVRTGGGEHEGDVHAGESRTWGRTMRGGQSAPCIWGSQPSLAFPMTCLTSSHPRTVERAPVPLERPASWAWMKVLQKRGPGSGQKGSSARGVVQAGGGTGSSPHTPAEGTHLTPLWTSTWFGWPEIPRASNVSTCAEGARM